MTITQLMDTIREAHPEHWQEPNLVMMALLNHVRVEASRYSGWENFTDGEQVRMAIEWMRTAWAGVREATIALEADYLFGPKYQVSAGSPEPMRTAIIAALSVLEDPKSRDDEDARFEMVARLRRAVQQYDGVEA